MAISTAQIKELRDSTGVGILDCRKALEASDGDMEKALDYLRERGLAKAAKRAGRAASEGVIEQYSHGDGRVGVMLELNCETDFVGRSEAFRTLAHEIALQIAAAAPLYISEEDIPQDALDRETAVASAKAIAEGKPEQIIPRIVEGFIKKYKEDYVLLNQEYIRDDSKTIQDMINEAIGAMGENIVVRRFARWELGETSEEETESEE
ncbi:MAG: translation elongation factor Ts [Anaerolineae bacterium]|jgi:elongation factor Ts|nr:translation elongation factor Ts [Anaerolineae bacterium]